MLDKLTSEQKHYLCHLVADHHNKMEAVRGMKERYPDSHDYKDISFYKFFESEEGRQLVEEATAKIREEAKTYSFAHRGSRVAVLVEEAGRVLRAVRKIPEAQVAGGVYSDAMKLLQGLLKDIRSEMEDLGVGDTEALDQFNVFINMVREGLPDFVMNSIKLPKVSKDLN